MSTAQSFSSIAASAWVDGSLSAAVLRRARIQPGERVLVVASEATALEAALSGSMGRVDDVAGASAVVVAIDAMRRSADPDETIRQLASRCLPEGRLILVESIASDIPGAFAALLRSPLNVQGVERMGGGGLLVAVRPGAIRR